MIQTIADYEEALSDTNGRLRKQGFDDFFSDLEYIEYTHRIDGVLCQGRLQVFRKAAQATWVAPLDGGKLSSHDVEPSLVHQLSSQICRLDDIRAAFVRPKQAGSVLFDPTGWHIVGRISSDEGKLIQGVFVIPADVTDEGFRDWLQLLYSTRPDRQTVRFS